VVKIKRAVISVSDKTGIVEFAQGLDAQGVEILSTGGTLALLNANGVRAKSISSYTKFPEIFEGRVKTLHPKVLGGLLFRRGVKSHVNQAKQHKIGPVDLIVVNLYPFHKIFDQKNMTLAKAIEQIDIGGPTMLRAASKNYESVAAVCNPEDYTSILAELNKQKGKLSEATRLSLAAKVFRLTAAYDSMIAEYLSQKAGAKSMPERIAGSYQKVADLRYGENPHQKAAYYESLGKTAQLKIKQLHGKELSYNNLLDMEAAWDAVSEFDEPAAAVIKHNTPCGLAAGKALAKAAGAAIDCDPMSAFGGIVSVNRKCDLATAKTIMEKLPFLEVVIAPSFEKTALERMMKRKNLRLVEMKQKGRFKLSYRFSKLGLLVQETDSPLNKEWIKFKKTARCVTKKKATAQDLVELFFAWRATKVVRSNGIVLTAKQATVGIGAGQTSRVDAVMIACRKAGKKTKGSYMGSDAFFPMPDNIQVAAKHGVRAIVQPGGSIKDDDVIKEANRHGIVIVLTGKRHFKH